MRSLSPMTLLIVSTLMGYLNSERLFFPGPLPVMKPGTFQLEGYYAESENLPIVVSDSSANSSTEKNENLGIQSRHAGFRVSDEAESRLLLPTIQENSEAKQIVPNFFPQIAPFQLTETVTVTRVIPPLCVACTCVQNARTCADAGGVQLVTYTVGIGAVAGGVPIGAIASFTASSAIACVVVSVSTGLPVPLPNAAAIPQNTAVTLSCILTPPAGLSVCDISCRSNTGTCSANPTTGNCPRFPEPNYCGTDCDNRRAGAVVRCNSASAAITSRPSTACPDRRKRSISHIPEIESTISTEIRQKRFAGFQLSRTTVTKTNTVSGTITATYVAAGNCLPSNVLAAPNC